MSEGRLGLGCGVLLCGCGEASAPLCGWWLWAGSGLCSADQVSSDELRGKVWRVQQGAVLLGVMKPNCFPGISSQSHCCGFVAGGLNQNRAVLNILSVVFGYEKSMKCAVRLMALAALL